MAFQEYQFSDWEVADAVQDALNRIDEAILSAHALAAQLRRKRLELEHGEWLLQSEIPVAAQAFASVARELGEATQLKREEV